MPFRGSMYGATLAVGLVLVCPLCVVVAVVSDCAVASPVRMKNARTLANAFIVKWPFRREMCAAYARRVDRLATSPVVASHRCRQSLDKSQLLEMKYFRIVGRRAPEKSVCAVNHLRPALLGSAAQIEIPSLCPA